ncbi:unnamed protein product, partial [Meganyctiphanes norvegica]
MDRRVIEKWNNLTEYEISAPSKKNHPGVDKGVTKRLKNNNIVQDRNDIRLKHWQMKLENNNIARQPSVDPQVTLQYSLTVSNPATGDIQIQSEAFPAAAPQDNTTTTIEGPPIKKRKVARNTGEKNTPYTIWPQRTYMCNTCPKTFHRINHLLIHQRTHTGERPFQCGVCYQAFTHKNSLTIHMRGHTGERPYVCSICGSAFTQKSNLRVHMRTHTGEKPFKCDQCEMAFTQGSHLTAHKRIHNNDRPFSCEICQQSFTQRSALKRHKRTHTGDRPHKCTECNARFSQKDDMRRHLRVHSGYKSFHGEVEFPVASGKKISCNFDGCQVTVNHNAAMNRHVRSCHAASTRVSKRGTSLNLEETPSQPTPMSELPSSDLPSSVSEPPSVSVPLSDTKPLTWLPSLDSDSSKTSSVKSLSPIKTEVIVKTEGKTTAKNKSSRASSTQPTQRVLASTTQKRSSPTVRTSKRIREVSQRNKKKKPDPDFIVGDFVDIDEEIVEAKVVTKPKQAKTSTAREMKSVGKAGVSEGQMEAWCFCEVPHGPDEPHTAHVHMDPGKGGRRESQVISEKTTTDVNRSSVKHVSSINAEATASLLQLSVEQITPSPQRTVIEEANTHIQSQSPTHVSSSLPLTSGSSSRGSHSLVEEQVIEQAGQVITAGNQIFSPASAGHIITSGGHIITGNSGGHLISSEEDGSSALGRVASQLIQASQVVTGSGQVVGGSQLMTPDGTIYIEAGEMLSNGAVILNSGQFISYDQITISADGQVLGVPIGASGGETIMIQQSGGGSTVETAVPPGTITYTANSVGNSSTPAGESVSSGSVVSAPPNMQYTTLGTDVISLFSHLEPVKEQAATIEVPVSDNSSNMVLGNVTIVAKPQECSVCGKSFAQKRTLKQHMDEAHPDLYSCSECCAAFTSPGHLETHKHQHLKHVCGHCGMSCNSKAALVRHRQQHQGQGPQGQSTLAPETKSFACDNCDARFLQQSDLRRHQLSHSGLKPFRCSHCDAGFTRTSSLNKHMRIHTGEKPYVCEECNQAFSYKYQFNRHKATHEQDESRTNYSMPYIQM